MENVTTFTKLGSTITDKLSVRDQLAMEAMKILLTTGMYIPEVADQRARMAGDAYGCADAMLRERDKPSAETERETTAAGGESAGV
jgi:hypothetical protein